MTICFACGKEIVSRKQLIYHHISYNPPRIVQVHRTCHGKIHYGHSEYAHLKPTQSSGIKIIKLSDETHKKLARCGEKGDTYEEIILKLMDRK